MVGVDDNIVPLPDADVHAGHGNRRDGDQISSNDLEGVSDEAEGEGVLDRCIDDADEMLLAGCEHEFLVATASAGRVDVFAVEKDIVTVGRRSWKAGDKGVGGAHDAGGELVDRAEVPIRDGQWAEVDVVVGRCRAVDHDWTKNAVSVLPREVRVVPAYPSASGSPIKHAFRLVGRRHVLVLTKLCRIE